MDLYMIRHAVAHERDQDRWPDDAERPLTPEGEEDFRIVARGLGFLMPPVRTLLSSPYARAWRTAELLSELEGWPEPKPLTALEPDISPEKTALALEAYENAEAVAVVGHRPCLHELAVYLLTGSTGGADVKIKKGGALLMSFDAAPRSGEGKLRWLLTPKVLRSLA